MAGRDRSGEVDALGSFPVGSAVANRSDAFETGGGSTPVVLHHAREALYVELDEIAVPSDGGKGRAEIGEPGEIPFLESFELR